ncbi:HNH endonuclease [Mesorhizobium sp. B2-4-2]|uniref:HNH endonuclease n=1 Tax=Mesorhizobium sp. B2-4-2 TaxID=2589947 RepID=UPI00112747B6|nr:HNH endonuclease [Mesorhizobium sp. B2-4-2]TPL58825.1 HNH endonuclease [Mesorhizobium sp. B2-4-2]
MIRLTRSAAPAYLTNAKVTELTSEFKATKESVWRKPQITQPLLSSSADKCAYCECKIDEESKYMEVEHFKNKNDFPDLVVQWDNLLPACKRCNVSKSTHDVVNQPIINPYDDEPRNHLYMNWYRFIGKDQKGKTTVDVISLNDTDRATTKRFQIGQQIHINISDIFDKLERYKLDGTVLRRNRLLGSVRNLLRECQRSSEYAATAATVVVNDELFGTVLLDMRALDIWLPDLDALYIEAVSISY